MPQGVSEKDSQISDRTLWVLLLAIFVTSFSLLTFEIALTRVLSVMLTYHYVFIVVSLALLGLGAGGIFVHTCRPWLTGLHRRSDPLALFASLFALSIPASVIAITLVAHLDNILLNLLILFFPFFFAGIILAEVFRTFPEFSSRIYGADLVGAAGGAFGVVVVLNMFNGINAVILLGLLAAVGALLFAVRAAARNTKGFIVSTFSLLALFGLLSANLAGSYLPDIPVGADPDKTINRALNSPERGEIIETRWSAFGRTDLVAFQGDTGIMGIFIDGTAGTPMFRFNGDFNNPNATVNDLKGNFAGYLPFSVLKEEERDNALVIGPGGGRDILLALMGGVRQITAVEVNQEVIDIVREYSDYNGGIYSDLQNVSVIVDEGRNFLKRQQAKYDIIMISFPGTKTSRSVEGYALTENFLFTTDSIADYLEHLTDEGRLIVVSDDQYEILRLLSISLATLGQRDVDNVIAMRQVYVVGSSWNQVFVMGKTPFEAAEMRSIRESIHNLGYDLTLSYLPCVWQGGNSVHAQGSNFEECSEFSPLFVSISEGRFDMDYLTTNLKEVGFDISPVTDNSPFFFKFEAGIPQPVSIVMWASLVMMILVVSAPVLYWAKKPWWRGTVAPNQAIFNRDTLRFVVLFSMLGIGFMVTEISLIQRLILFLGKPVLSLAVLLFSLLVGAGLGSWYSGRFHPEKMARRVAVVCLLIIAVLGAYTFSLSPIFGSLLGLALPLRLLAAVLILTPLGFLMGFPFPSAIRLLREMERGNYIPWMWGINGIGSVLGSSVAMVIAIVLGLTEALLIAAACYLIVFLAFRTFSRLSST